MLTFYLVQFLISYSLIYRIGGKRCDSADIRLDYLRLSVENRSTRCTVSVKGRKSGLGTDVYRSIYNKRRTIQMAASINWHWSLFITLLSTIRNNYLCLIRLWVMYFYKYLSEKGNKLIEMYCSFYFNSMRIVLQGYLEIMVDT